MPDATSRVLVPAIAAALQGVTTTADILVAINVLRDNPLAVRDLVLEALVGLEQVRMTLTLEVPFPDEL